VRRFLLADVDVLGAGKGPDKTLLIGLGLEAATLSCANACNEQSDLFYRQPPDCAYALPRLSRLPHDT